MWQESLNYQTLGLPYPKFSLSKMSCHIISLNFSLCCGNIFTTETISVQAFEDLQICQARCHKNKKQPTGGVCVCKMKPYGLHIIPYGLHKGL